MTITIVIIAVTVVTSVLAFYNQRLTDDLIFDPPAITYRKQWYRFVTCGFIHADFPHLAFNMFSLYIFGEEVERLLMQIFGDKGKLVYILLYLTSLITCLLPTYSQHKDNYGYRSLGASGAISAIAFCFMILLPVQGIGLIFIPIYIPAFIFAPLYLITTSVLAKQGNSHINHSAHLWGAIYGVAFLIVTCYALSDFKVIENFTYQVSTYMQSKLSLFH